MLSKIFGWVGMVGAIAGVVAQSVGVVGQEVAHYAAVIGAVLASIANPITRSASARQRTGD